MRRVVPILACFMLLAVFAMPVNVSAEDQKCLVLFDFGDGEIGWASVDVAAGMNAFNITEKAAEQLGYQLTVSWWGESPFIDAINGHFPDYSDWSDMIYWGFYTWDNVTGTWQSSWVGPADVDGESVSAIAWSYTASPSATPDHKNPWTSFRKGAAGMGSQPVYAPNNITLGYSKDLASGSIESPIVSANGYSYMVASGVVNYTTYGHDTNSTLFCLDSEGEEVWSAEIGKGYQTSSPLIFNGLIVVSSADGTVYAFNMLTGAEAWKYEMGTGEVYGAPSPIGVTNRIYVASAEGEIVCLKMDGSEDWDLDLEVDIYSSSLSAEYDMLFIGAENGTLNAIDVSTGELSWFIDLGGKVRGTPMCDDGNIYVTYINYTGSSATSGGVAAVDLSGNLLWQTETGVTPASATLTASGIATVDSSSLYMIDMDGNIVWELGLGTMFSGGAPASVDGTIFLVTNEENSRLVGVSETGTMYINRTLVPADYALCAPTIADGRLYVSTDGGYVYAYDLNEVAASTVTSDMVIDGMGVSFAAIGAAEGTYFEYEWDFGDGNESSEAAAAHEYAEAGTYNAKLTVTAPNGDFESYDIVVVIEEAEEESGDDMVIWFIVIAAVIIVAVLAFVMLRRRK